MCILPVHHQGECYTCGQPVSGRMVNERGELLVVAESIAAEKVSSCEREASVNERVLQDARRGAGRWDEIARVAEAAAVALKVTRERAEELVARRAELR